MANGIAYIGSFHGKVYALNAAAGAVDCSYTTGNVVYSSPAVRLPADELDVRRASLTWTRAPPAAARTSRPPGV